MSVRAASTSVFAVPLGSGCVRLLAQIRPPADECEGCDGCGRLVTTKTDGRVVEWECTDCGGTGRVGEGGHDV